MSCERGPKILKEINNLLKIEPGKTKPDMEFSLNVVNCLGACAIGPVMMVNGKFYGEMNPLKSVSIRSGKMEGGYYSATTKV